MREVRRRGRRGKSKTDISFTLPSLYKLTLSEKQHKARNYILSTSHLPCPWTRCRVISSVVDTANTPYVSHILTLLRLLTSYVYSILVVTCSHAPQRVP